VLEKYPKEVKLVMKNFPLPSHSFARKAAIAALAAGKQRKFWEMHEKLYANQKELSEAKVEAIARELLLNMEQFNKDLKDPSLGALVDRDISDGHRANVRGTPTVFVNGKLVNQRNLLGMVIEEELKKKKK
jgi:protein-disulfide isomerase